MKHLLKQFVYALFLLFPLFAQGQSTNSLDALLQPPDGVASLFEDKTPVDTLESKVLARIKERMAFDGVEIVHVLVLTANDVMPLVRDEWAANGFELIGKYDADIWIARTDVAGLRFVLTSGAVNDIAVIPAQAKLSTRISLVQPFEWQKSEREDALVYTVLFHKGVSTKEIDSTLQAVLNRAVVLPDDAAFVYSRAVDIDLSAEELRRLAELDIVEFIEPKSAPLIDDNLLNTQPLSNVDDVQVAPHNLSGQGVTVGVWEAGDVVRASHVDLTPRVTVQAGQTSSQDGHAVHVAGTIGASGVNIPNAEGMAPEVAILSFDASSDSGEMGTAAAVGAANRILASNHSYGTSIGWNNAGTSFNNNQATFGSYTSISVAFDTVVAGDGVAATPTELVIVKSAGNDRNDGPGTSTNPDDCQQGGLGIDADCIGPRGSAKNTITVGAMDGAGMIAGFSNFGPTNDGRLKPDVMANGTNVLSLGEAGSGTPTDNGSTTRQGTSMAAPAVTGIVALLSERMTELGVVNPLASTFKALLIQTARDVAGTGQATVGPDYATGWGIADAEAAVNLLNRGGGPGYAEGVIAATGAAGAWDFPLVVDTLEPELKVTLAWSDLPGTPTGNGVELVNDLDLRLLPPDGGATVQPWTLNAASPGDAAVRDGGDDAINNVEQVSVLNPVPGTWTVRVTAKAGSLALGGQPFSVAGPLTPIRVPATGPKANIMMVLDKSGSMILPAAASGLNKMQALEIGSTAFVDFMELVGGHNLGIVAFDTNITATSPVVNLGILNSTLAGNARTAIGNLSPGGWTNIIEGVTTAVGQQGGAAATNPDNIIVLFSDGRHNRPTGSDVSSIDSAMPNDTRFFSIGYGTDVDSAVMPGVAANHAGVHLEEQSLQPGQLAKLFMVVAGLAADESIIVDPDFPLSPGNRAHHSVLATSSDSTLTFAAFWNESQRNKMALTLIGPDKRCDIPVKPHQGLDVRHGNNHSIVRLSLPYTCSNKRGSLSTLHEGHWHLLFRNAGEKKDVAKILVLSDSTLNLDLNTKVSGDRALLSARLVDGGKLQREGVRITAHLWPNRPSSGDSEKQDAIALDTPIKPPLKGPGGILDGRPILIDSPFARSSQTFRTASADDVLSVSPLRSVNPALANTLLSRATEMSMTNELLGQLRGRFTLPVKATHVDLRDDGTGGDIAAGDGVFSALVQAPHSGLFQMRLIASQATRRGVVTREQLSSFFVK